MKKFAQSLGVIAVLAFTSITGVQAQTFDKGNSLLNVGVGLGSTLTGAGLKTTLPPVGISYEYGVTDKISAGLYLGYSSAEAEVLKWKYTYLVFGARGSYHFMMNDKMDLYGGLMAGYNSVSIDVTGAPSASAVLIGGHLGGRYYFTEKLGAFAELGYGIAYLQVGLAAKF